MTTTLRLNDFASVSVGRDKYDHPVAQLEVLGRCIDTFISEGEFRRLKEAIADAEGRRKPFEDLVTEWERSARCCRGAAGLDRAAADQVTPLEEQRGAKTMALRAEGTHLGRAQMLELCAKQLRELISGKGE